MTRRNALITFLTLLFLSGCASAPLPTTTDPSPALRLYNTYGRALEAGALVYTESMLAAGEAHARGAITDEQLSAIRNAGRNVEVALRMAKAALQLYVAQGQDGSADDLSIRFSSFSRSLADLARLLAEAEVAR